MTLKILIVVRSAFCRGFRSLWLPSVRLVTVRSTCNHSEKHLRGFAFYMLVTGLRYPGAVAKLQDEKWLNFPVKTLRFIAYPSPSSKMAQ